MGTDTRTLYLPNIFFSFVFLIIFLFLFQHTHDELAKNGPDINKVRYNPPGFWVGLCKQNIINFNLWRPQSSLLARVVHTYIQIFKVSVVKEYKSRR